LTLGGHQNPVEDLAARIDAIETLHQDRLNKVMSLVDRPRTTAEVSSMLFPEVHGYNILLALEETGAHVEFLAQRGYLAIGNISELEGDCPVAIRYRRLDGPVEIMSRR
jgi:hypothetical protein